MLVRVLAVLLLVTSAWGAWGEWRLAAIERQATEERLLQQESAREAERLSSRSNATVADQLAAANRRVADARRGAADRLRERADAAASAPATAACRSLEAAPVEVLPGPTREALVDLAAEADELSARLAACQAYIREVVRPDGIADAASPR